GRVNTTAGAGRDPGRHDRLQPEGDPGIPRQSRTAQRSDGRPLADVADYDRRKVGQRADGRARLSEGWRSDRGDRVRQWRSLAPGLVSESATAADRDGRSW